MDVYHRRGIFSSRESLLLSPRMAGITLGGSMRMWRNKENSQPHVPVRQATSTDSGDSLLTQLDRTTSRMKQSPNIGKGLTVAQIIGESRNIRQQFTSGNLRAAWDRRVELGFGVPSDGVPQADRFWLDAAPAIAALRLGIKDDPIVRMCCGTAERNFDRSSPEQCAAVEEFNRLFFGNE